MSDSNSSKLFLVTYDALIGRTKEDNNQHTPMQVTFYATVRAANAAAVNDIVVQYRDPGFTARVTNVQEIGDGLTSDELHDLLALKKVLVEVK